MELASRRPGAVASPRRTARSRAFPWLALACGVLLAAPASPAPEPAAASPMELYGITFVATRAGVTELVLEAERARLDPATQVAELEVVRARLLGADGRVRMALACDRGRFDLSSNDLTAQGHVHARTEDGRSFSSEHLRYQHATGVASTDSPVSIQEGERSLRGGGLRYYVREGRLRLLGGASVVDTP